MGFLVVVDAAVSSPGEAFFLKDIFMRKQSYKLIIAALAMSTAAISMPAFAQDAEAEAAGPITVSGGATVVSDYRFRGVSLSAEQPTLQGTATVSHESGFYVGAWGSGLADGTPYGGSEIDIYAGWGGDVAGLKVDANVTQYTYPNQTGSGAVDYLELLGSVSKDIGPLNAKVGVGFVPKQSGYGNFSGVYVSHDPAAGTPNTPFTVKAHVGYNKSDFSVDTESLDYSFGLDTTWKALTLGISYVNTTVKPNLAKETLGADGAVLFSLGAAF
jgi:uncharacterized protein (TIGR02001 family)